MKRFMRPFQQDTSPSSIKDQMPPVWFMRQAGRYLPEYRELRTKAANFLEFCYTPDLAVEATLQPIRRYGFDASIMFSDILVIPDAMGQDVAFKEGTGPILKALESKSDIDALSVARVLEHLTPVFEVITRLRRELPSETSLIGFAGSPWTLAFYMIEGRGGVDGGKLKRMAYGNPDDFASLFEMLEDALVAYLNQQISAGVDVLQLFDSWSGIADEALFKRWVIEPTKRIIDRVKEKHPSVPILGFPRGSGVLAKSFAIETGVDGMSMDSQMPLSWAIENLPKNIVLQGNLDNQLLITGGDVMDAEVRRICDVMRDRRFVFNLGHGILPQTPPEHVGRVLEIIRQGKSG